MKNIFILGIGSDIGQSLAARYLSEGCNVTGAYRHKNSLKGFLSGRDRSLIRCDIESKSNIKRCLNRYKKSSKPWDVFISCVGSLEPIGKFFECDFDRWERSVNVNSIAQLRFLRLIYPYRRKGKPCHVVFFAGGGTNKSLTNYSAYCASKIFLIKMCELLDDENRDLNVFIIGPGWARTKIHNQTMGSRLRSDRTYQLTDKFLRSQNPGTGYGDIYDCINWCIGRGSRVAGGRNISVLHDDWQKRGASLARQLRADPDKFKLRRFR
ncbi:MAG: SDR family NAD(P)-dependent oxidoreductase [Candidatus Omnitrophica bacterium]|nr:SDR family NAD(P)-dependent oxidoreductase [Candidatus Omnitrophota bacterium]